MNELVIDRIRWLMELPEMYSAPGKNGFFVTQEEKSIIRWTCMELMLVIMDRPYQDALDTIQEFGLQMAYFRSKAPSEKVRRTFETVVDAVYTIQLNL